MSRIRRGNRVSIDMDTFNMSNFYRRFFNARIFGKVVSKITGHGYHIVIKRKCNTKENIHIRKMLGDCASRIEMDERRVELGWDDIVDTLFFRKTVEGITTGEEDFNPLAEPFWIPRNHVR